MTSIVSVIGAGAGAFCWAAYLSERGFPVYMGSRSMHALEDVAACREITMLSKHGTSQYKIAGVMDPIKAVEKAELAILCVPADHLPAYKSMLIDVLSPGQVLVLAPGGVGGALFFGSENGFRPKFHMIELNTLPFIARKRDSTTVQRMVVLKKIFWAALPANDEKQIQNIVNDLLPFADCVPSVLQTSLTNYNSIIHPVAMIMNAGRIEAVGSFRWYSDGSTPAIGRLMDAMDKERLAIQKELGLSQLSFQDYFDQAGYAPGTPLNGSIGRTLRESEPNATITGPNSLDHRFITEDVPFGLVPLEAISRVCGSDSTIISSVINMCDVALGIDFRNLGLNASRLGIQGLTKEELLGVVKLGKSDQ